MFHQVPQPLHYAEALLQRFAGLARTASGEALLGGLVEAAAQLSGCALSQLYLLDDTHTRLTLSAEWQDGLLQPRAGASLPSDYDGEQLLQYCLCQNQVLSLDELDGNLHQIGFLPEAGEPWRSLLCLPLLDEQKQVNGLRLIASQPPRDLLGFAGALGHLGSVVIAQLHLLQRLRTPRSAQPCEPLSSERPSHGPPRRCKARPVVAVGAGCSRWRWCLSRLARGTRAISRRRRSSVDARAYRA
jgi:sigma-54-dependent transcriptional regulator